MSSTQQQQSSSTTTPWAPQAAALTSAFSNANSAYGQASQAQAPTNYTAQFTPDQLATFHRMLGYANGTSTAPLTNAGNSSATAGSTGASDALSGLNSYNPSATNNPAALNAAANEYVSGQNIPAEVQNAMLAANQNARDVTLPGIEQDAAISGNADSSRNGIAQGLVERGLAEQAGALSGTLQSQAYQNGLQLAENQANNNNTNYLSALSNEGNIGTNTLNAGTNAANSGISDQGALYSIASNAGAGEQAANQAQLTNELQQYQAQVQDPYAALNGYMGIIGSNNWGAQSNGTSTTETTPSALSVIGGLLGAAAGGAQMAGGLGWKPFA